MTLPLGYLAQGSRVVMSSLYIPPSTLCSDSQAEPQSADDCSSSDAVSQVIRNRNASLTTLSLLQKKWSQDMRTQSEEKEKLSKQLVIISGWVAADSLNQESTSREKQSLQSDDRDSRAQDYHHHWLR